MNLIEELVKFWNLYAPFKDADEKYFNRLIECNRINYVSRETLIGVCESWRVDYEQLGRIMCHEPVDIFKENITDGPVAYVNNVIVHPNHRDGLVLKTLQAECFMKNFGAKYFGGNRLKKTTPFRIYKREEVSYGWERIGSKR